MTPSESDKLEFAALLKSESRADDTRRELSAVQINEMEELSRPIYGGVFADENDLDFDLDKAHFDQDKRKMQPREVSTLAQDLTDLKMQCRNIGALDVDCFAETLLERCEPESPVEHDVPLDGFTMEQFNEFGRHLAFASTVKRKGFVGPEQLARNWNIGHELAKRTVEATTQLAVRDFTGTQGNKRLKPSTWVLNFDRVDADVYTDTFYGKCKSLRGNKYCQIFATEFHFVRAYPMEFKNEAHFALDDWFHENGVPRTIICDNAREMTHGVFRKKVNKVQCKIRPIEAYHPNSNFAEDAIRELQRLYERTMLKTNAHPCFWDWCIEWCALIRSHVAWNMHKLNGKTPATKMTGDTPDISFLAEFGWFDFIWYFPAPKAPKKLGRYLGPSMTVGSAMCGTVITEKATHLDRTSIMPLTREDLNDPAVQAKMVEFMTELTTKLDARMARQGDHCDVDAPGYVDPNEVHDEFQAAPYTENYEPWTPEELGFDPDSVEHKPQWGDLPEADDTEADKVDFDENKYIAAKVMIPKEGFDFAVGKVIG